jgi:hypothetical protein
MVFIDPALDAVTSMSNIHLPIFTGDGHIYPVFSGPDHHPCDKEADDMCIFLMLYLDVTLLSKVRKVTDLRGSLGNLTCY